MAQQSQESSEEQRYMRERWQPQLDYYSKQAQRYKQRHLGLLFASSVGAAIVPVLLMFPGVPLIIPAIVSLMVSLALILDNTFHFSDDWRLFSETREALKQEKILYVYKVEPYTDASEAFPLFVRNCEDIMGAEGKSYFEQRESNRNEFVEAYNSGNLVVSNVLEVASVSPQLDTQTAFMPQRHVNVTIIRQENRNIVSRTTSLGMNSMYALRLNIGFLLDESVVQNAEQYPFPIHFLPPTNIGYWLEVIVVSDDFVIPVRQHHLFLPKLGPSWICDCPPGKDHQCNDHERQPYLFISIQTPAQPQVARLRIAVYYQKNLIQSQILTARVVEIEQRGAGYNSIIDYTLTSDLRDLSFLPPRTLNILTNDNMDGSHRIVINGEEDVIAFNITEGQTRVTVDAAREALRNVHFEEYGGALGSKRQRRNFLNSNNAKTKEAFIEDLIRLAPLGWKLWTLLLKDRLEWRKKLLAPATIQVSRTISSTLAFPWALVYDIPLASQGPYKICPLLENWDENKGFIDLTVPYCPHESTHDVKNTLCPFGFWGFRHVIEQPASMPMGRNLPMSIHLTNQPPALVAGLSQTLDKNQTAKHLWAMKHQLTLLAVQEHTSLQGIITALSAPVEVVYFYCHGGRELLVGTNQHIPYLQVGEDERFQPSDITTWGVADWPEHHWEQTSPLVFINGCHTAELTPELLVNFVDAFSTAYAAGVIGTEISVEQGIAAEAAEHFFNAFQQNKTVGEALRQMRLHFLVKGNLLGLVYTPYCSANLHL